MIASQICWLERCGHQSRILLGRKALLIQGYPTTLVPALVHNSSESLMQNVAVTMVASPVLLSIVQATFASVPWKHGPKAACTSQGDVDAALLLVGLSGAEKPCEKKSKIIKLSP